MPLSNQIKQACIQALAGLNPGSHSEHYSLGKDRENDPVRDLLYFQHFFSYFKETPDSDLRDNDVIIKLFETLEDFQLEQRTIPESSYRVKAVIKVFLENVKDHPFYPLIKENFDQLQGSTPTQQQTRVNEKTQQYVNRYAIILQGYLDSLEVIDDTTLNQMRQFSQVFNGNKTIKSVNNPKVIAMKNIAFNLKLLSKSGKYILYHNGIVNIQTLSNQETPEIILNILQNIIDNELTHQNLSVQGYGHFYSTISLLKGDIQSELSSGTTLAVCPEITQQQITTTLTKELKKEAKTLRRLEPANIFRSGSSSSSSNILTRNVQKFGGEDQILVITSVRQSINQRLHEKYKQKKQEFNEANKTKSCTNIKPMSIEQEILESNEVLLLHGTSVNASASIFENGYQQPKETSYLNFFSSLGPAIYFTQDYLKAGTFASCPLCGKVQCDCTISAGQKVERCVIINKVALGNTYVTLTKGKIPDGYDSAVGISKEDNPNSAFNSSEIGIINSAQVLPLFEVKYFTYENMLILNKWPEDVPALTHLIELIEDVEKFNTNRSINFTQKIKRECERLLQDKNLRQIYKKNVSALLAQINIETTYPNIEAYIDNSTIAQQGTLRNSGKI